MQRLNCSLCNQLVPGELDGLRKHLVNDHALSINRGMGDSGFQCAQNGCRRSFRFFYSLRRHIKKIHLNNVDDNDEAGNDDDEMDNNVRIHQFDDIEVNYGDAHNEQMGENSDDKESVASNEDNIDIELELKKYVIQMVARFQCKPSMTSSLLTEVLDECEQLLRNTCKFLKQKVERFLDIRELQDDNEAQNVLSAFDLDDPFDTLRTLEQQINTLKQHFSYIEPIEIPLGYRPDSVLDRKTTTYKPKMVMETFQYVSVISTLTLVLSSPEVREAINAEQRSPDGILASFLDGEHAQQHPLFLQYPNALRLQLYYDELETVNPLGSKTGIHKLGVFYYTIQNLPPQINSELSSIHVLIMCSDADVKKYGFKKILAPFLEELKKLESDDGFVIETDDGNYVLRASIAAFCGDGLAVHDVFNFLAPSSNYFCRMCMYSRNDLHSGNLQPGQERTIALYDQHLARLRVTNFSAETKRTTGIRGECCLNDSKYFHIMSNKIFDPMHDFLCGICPMILKLVLHEYIVIQNKLTCEEFNGRITSFQYGYVEMTNKPSANFTDSMLRKNDHTLSQRAMQIWCLTRAFPFLISNEIPTGDPHMALVINLLQIMEIIFAPRINENCLIRLRNLNRDFNVRFRILFPNVNAINKFHHKDHYEEFIRWAGPAINYWCMRYEAKHGGVKARGQVVHNHKNLPKTLIRLCQCEQSAKWGGKDVKINRMMTTNGRTVHVEDTASKEFLYDFDYIDTDRVFRCNSAKVNGVEYRVGLYVCVEAAHVTQDNLPSFGCIREIIILRNIDVYLFISKYITIAFDEEVYAYHITHNDTDVDKVFVKTSKLAHFKPICCWVKQSSDNLYINLRHIIL